jgi:hypothetical protein
MLICLGSGDYVKWAFRNLNISQRSKNRNVTLYYSHSAKCNLAVVKRCSDFIFLFLWKQAYLFENKSLCKVQSCRCKKVFRFYSPICLETNLGDKYQLKSPRKRALVSGTGRLLWRQIGNGVRWRFKPWRHRLPFKADSAWCVLSVGPDLSNALASTTCHLWARLAQLVSALGQ